MRLLLDSHCLIWLLSDAPELSAKARAAIVDAQGVWFSDASIWELGLKWRKGKIAVQPRRIAEQALRNGLRPLPVTQQAMILSCEMKHDHADPFDRLLYAQAKTERMRLLSIDRALAGLGAVVLAPR